MSIIGRLQVDHPALGTAGGSALHASIEAIYKKLADNITSRIMVALSVSNGATQTFEHDFREAFANLRWDLYIAANSDPYDLTRITSSSSPSRSQFTVAANGTNPTTQIDVTNNSGASRNLVLVVQLDPLSLFELDVLDVDPTGITDGQILAYQASSGKFIPADAGVNAIAQDFTGLKRFLSGISSAEYVGINPEVGGSTPFQLTVSHKRVQVINPAGAITVKLPTTSLKSGERLRIVNRSANAVTIQSSDGTQLGIVTAGAMEFFALQDTPTSGAHWAQSASQYATDTVDGLLSTAAQDLGGLKRGLGGLSSAEYVGTNPEVGGASPFQLTVSHKRVQVINPAGAITVKLPTTSVKTGERVKIVNRSTNLVTIQSSGGNQLAIIKACSAEFIALQDTPTADTHWANASKDQGEPVKYVGIGPNCYSLLSDALTAASAGDLIKVMASVSETVAINIPAGVEVQQMPNTLVTLTNTAFASGAIRLTGANAKWRGMNAKVTGINTTLAKACSIEAADCKLEGDLEIDCTGQTVTDAVNIASGGTRAYVQVGVKRTAGTITNLETNADGAGKSDVWGG